MTEQLPDAPNSHKPYQNKRRDASPRHSDDARRPARSASGKTASPRKGSWNHPKPSPGTSKGQPSRRFDRDAKFHDRPRREDGDKPAFRNDRPRPQREDGDKPAFRNDRPRARWNDAPDSRAHFRRYASQTDERADSIREDDAAARPRSEFASRRPRPVYDAWNPRPQAPEPEQPAVPYARKRRLTIFGGSFDPIHNGHIALASKIIENELTDEIMFVPTRLQPLKPAGALATPEQRLEMLSLAIMGHQAFAYTDIEILREDKPSFTYDTASLLACAYPDCEISILIGMDSFCTLASWHRASELISHFKFLIYPRPGCNPPSLPYIQELCGMRNAVKLFNSILPAEEYDLFNVSATQIRDNIAHNRRIDNLVPPAVERYIIDNQLYQS